MSNVSSQNSWLRDDIADVHNFIEKTEKTPAGELLIAPRRMKEIDDGSFT
jgi:phage-related protein